MKKLVSTFSGVKASIVSFLFLALAAVNTFAQSTAILDLSDVTDRVETEVGGAAPVIAAIIGITLAIGIVVSIVRRVRN